ncbi:MAG TPA: cytochrome P450 [Herpetosiphonaceae bacterium]
MTVREQLDITSAAAKPHTYATYARLRAEAPIFKASLPNGDPLWLVTRYEDVVAIFKDERFAKNFRNAMTPEQLATMPVGGLSDFAHRNMLFIDPPDHARLRSLVARGFTPARIEALRPRIQQIADELIDALPAGEPFDLLDAYAFPLPITVISEMLGVPHEDREQFRVWSNVMVNGDTMLPNEPLRMQAMQAFGGYIYQLIERRRAEPRDDLVSLLVQAEEQGDRLDVQELMAMIFLLIVAGHETTVNLIANGVLALLANPGQLALLKAQPELIKNAVEELLRFDGPVETSTMRFAREDVAWGDQLIRRGERVLVIINSADRDPEIFENPDELDITRQIKHHVAFGHGIHYCLGAPLARLEGQVAIGTLLRRLPGLRLAVPAEQLTYRQSMLIRGLEQFPVVADEVAPAAAR